jgi:mRNA-degrading endonuclease toxin of MazEF toxin-antitoxin module
MLIYFHKLFCITSEISQSKPALQISSKVSQSKQTLTLISPIKTTKANTNKKITFKKFKTLTNNNKVCNIFGKLKRKVDEVARKVSDE